MGQGYAIDDLVSSEVQWREVFSECISFEGSQHIGLWFSYFNELSCKVRHLLNTFT